MLIDIDIDQLKFFLYPDMETLKPLIEAIKEGYIAEYGEEYREKIEQNMLSVNDTIFVDRKNRMKYFINQFLGEIIISVYQKLAQTFKVSLDLSLKNNFIEIAFANHHIDNIRDDRNLEVLRGEIRKYLVNTKENTEQLEETLFLDEQIKWVDETIMKFDKIMEVLKPAMDDIKKTDEEIQKIENMLIKQILEKHNFMLTNQEKEFILKNPDYQAKDLIKRSSNLQKYIDLASPWTSDLLQLGECNFFKKDYYHRFSLEFKKQNLLKWGLDPEDKSLDIEDGEACFNKTGFTYIGEDRITYQGIPAVDKMEEELNIYNDMYRTYQKPYDFSIPREELWREILRSIIKQSSIFLDSEALKEIGTATSSKIEWILKSDMSCNGTFFAIDYDNNYKMFDERQVHIAQYFSLIILFYLKNLEIENGIVWESMLYSFSHEIGHMIAQDSKKITGFNTKEEYTYLNEFMNEYINRKVFNRLRENGYIRDGNGIKHAQKCFYLSFLFLLEPFLNKYEDVFKKAAMENNPDLLIDCMGLENFESYLQIINQCYTYASENKDQFFKEETINQVKNKVDEILLAVNERNKTR